MKARSLFLLSLGQMLALSVWFSASAVTPQLEMEWSLGPAAQAWLTMSVQIGFVVGALGIAILGLADRVSSRALIVVNSLVAAAANAAIPLFEPGLEGVIGLRLATGVAMAGIYPPAMRLAASWTQRDRGLGIGLLIGALTVGSSIPHLLNAVPILGADGMPPWRAVLWSASGLALLGAMVVALGVRQGPHLPRAKKFEWDMATNALRLRPLRLTNFGYFGHMWELYAVWTWVPIFLIGAFADAGWSATSARMVGFVMVAVGAVGCLGGGYLADRLGRTRVTIWSLALSGTCCLLAGPLAGRPILLTVVCLVWGVAVIADSGQFSAAASELADPEWVGTALTVQTSLGFLLTLGTIRLVPLIRDAAGWSPALAVLAVGPAFGIVSMMRLRRLPEAEKMASGRR